MALVHVYWRMKFIARCTTKSSDMLKKSAYKCSSTAFSLLPSVTTGGDSCQTYVAEMVIALSNAVK